MLFDFVRSRPAAELTAGKGGMVQLGTAVWSVRAVPESRLDSARERIPLHGSRESPFLQPRYILRQNRQESDGVSDRSWRACTSASGRGRVITSVTPHGADIEIRYKVILATKPTA